MPRVRRVWPLPIDGKLVNSNWFTRRFNEFRQEHPGVTNVVAEEVESVLHYRRCFIIRGDTTP